MTDKQILEVAMEKIATGKGIHSCSAIANNLRGHPVRVKYRRIFGFLPEDAVGPVPMDKFVIAIHDATRGHYDRGFSSCNLRLMLLAMAHAVWDDFE